MAAILSLWGKRSTLFPLWTSTTYLIFYQVKESTNQILFHLNSGRQRFFDCNDFYWVNFAQHNLQKGYSWMQTSPLEHNDISSLNLLLHKQQARKTSMLMWHLFYSVPTFRHPTRFLKGAWTHGHFTCVGPVLAEVRSSKGQKAAELESLVEVLNCGAGRCPFGDRTPVDQPAHLCEADRHLPRQTDQSGLAGRERIGGRTVECQDRRREAGAWTMKMMTTWIRDIIQQCTHFDFEAKISLQDLVSING